MENEYLESRWLDLFGFTNEIKTSKKYFEILINKYSEEHRLYHNIRHISKCLSYLDEVKNNVNSYFDLEVAIWFHDAIYKPNRSDNEEKSAQIAMVFLKSIGLEASEIIEIEHLILLTKHPSKPNSNDDKYMIDIDLSILGAKENDYDNYEAWIRKEYSSVPWFLYRRGRKSLLESFANKRRIYKTDYFQEKLEEQARHNIDRALNNF